jgi:hypothetical protein
VFVSRETAVVSTWLLGLPVHEGGGTALAIQGIQAVMFGTLGGWLGSLILPADPRTKPARPT